MILFTFAKINMEVVVVWRTMKYGLECTILSGPQLITIELVKPLGKRKGFISGSRCLWSHLNYF